MISFEQIPDTICVPGSYVEFDGTGARTGQSGKPYRIAVFGPKLAIGTALADVPVQVGSAAQASTLFGPGSALQHMATCLFKTNSINEVWFVPQADDAAGVARVVSADYSTAYTSAATLSGIERVYIAETEYRAAVALGDTATDVAGAMADAINADPEALFVAVAAGTKLTLTAKNKGELPNDIQVVAQYASTDYSPSGAFVTFAQDTAGAGNPSVAAGLASMSTMDITHVVNPYNDATNYALLLAEAQDRWAPLPSATSLGNGQNDFIVFGAFRGTESQFKTFMDTRNSEYFTTAYVEPGQTISGVQHGGLMSTAWSYAAAYAAKSAALASVVANNPHQLVVLPCLKPAPMATRAHWNLRNRVACSYGGATYTYNAAQQVMIETAITERTTTDSGAPTDAERRVETQLAKSYIRWSLRQMLDSVYPRSRLANDGTPGLPNNVATPSMIKGSIIGLCKNVWVPNGIVEDFAGFKSTIIVERSTSDCNTIKFQIFPDLVNILTVKAGKVSYIVC